MDFRSPLFLLRQHKGIALLLVLEIAFGFVLSCLAWQALQCHRRAASGASGIDERGLWMLGPFGRGEALPPQRVIDALRGTPGLHGIAAVNQVPYSRNSWNMSLWSQPSQQGLNTHASVYMGDAGLFDLLHAPLHEGRAFAAGEYGRFEGPPASMAQEVLPAIVTQGLARRLFPQGSALGRQLHGWPGMPMRIVGIVDRLPQPQGSRGAAAADASLILPLAPADAAGAFFLLRLDPRRQDAAATHLRQQIARLAPRRALPDLYPLDALRHDASGGERRWMWTLAICAIGWWTLTLLSIGAASQLWVQHTTWWIGLHRAVGATRRQMMRVVRLENFLLAGLGIALGTLAVLLLAPHLPGGGWAIDPAPWGLMCACALAIWLLAQVAVSGAARRAGEVPPDHLTRLPCRL